MAHTHAPSLIERLMHLLGVRTDDIPGGEAIDQRLDDYERRLDVLDTRLRAKARGDPDWTRPANRPRSKEDA